MRLERMRQKALDFGGEPPRRDTRPRHWSVSQLTERLRGVLETEFFDVWVEGEVSNLVAAQSGHWYFSLKDERAQIRAVLFRKEARLLPFRPKDGMQVLARGGVRVYPPRGEYQLQVELLEPRGKGSLQQAFEELKERLSKEGLFDPARKRRLPMLPRRIGVVTSPQGAVIRDILRVLRRRYANLEVLVYPARVQGAEAAREIAQGIDVLDRLGGLDVIVVARGGGSLEDLWPFNEEIVARALAASRLPTVSAVGHETDYTIADFVADLRAPTPSAAAELVVEAKADLLARLAALDKHLAAALERRLARARARVTGVAVARVFAAEQGRLRRHAQRVDELSARSRRALALRLERAHAGLRRAGERLETFRLERQLAERRRRVADVSTRLGLAARARRDACRARLDALARRLTRAAERDLERPRARLREALGRLDSLSPVRVLARGYALVFGPGERLLRAPGDVAVGDALRVRLHGGTLRAAVTSKEPA
jgi:exodeoxyribonuclease VII large subunit